MLTETVFTDEYKDRWEETNALEEACDESKNPLTIMLQEELQRAIDNAWIMKYMEI